MVAARCDSNGKRIGTRAGPAERRGGVQGAGVGSGCACCGLADGRRGRRTWRARSARYGPSRAAAAAARPGSPATATAQKSRAAGYAAPAAADSGRHAASARDSGRAGASTCVVAAGGRGGGGGVGVRGQRQASVYAMPIKEAFKVPAEN